MDDTCTDPDDGALGGERWVLGGELDTSPAPPQQQQQGDDYIGPICVDSDTFTFTSQVDPKIQVLLRQERHLVGSRHVCVMWGGGREVS